MYAAIDLGSNSFHLLIARLHDQHLEQYDRYSDKVQLAEGLVSTGSLSKAAMDRAFDCLDELRHHLDCYDVQAVRAVGTYALRSAKNAAAFVEQAEVVLGVPIQVLTGESEARLIYQGIYRSQRLNSSALTVDIGGGSTEFAIGSGATLDFSISEDMGCVTLRDQYFHPNKVRVSDYEQALADVAQWVQLPASAIDEFKWTEAWGSSGTMKAVARILNALHGCGFVIQRARLHALAKHMLSHRSYSALRYPYLNEDRKSTILPGIAIISQLMDELAIEELNVSRASLREGMVWKMATGEAFD